ncbi:hypothetical protein ACGK9R_16895 [Halomonas sp. HNIBRBA4712]|uniref:hypothetical protein n=1 Tax=Halomonas sp. HNIBRBA4712 TaxID=3373087 RepID=UPI0037477514
MLINTLEESFSILRSDTRYIAKALVGPLALALTAELMLLGVARWQPMSLTFYFAFEAVAEAIHIASYTLMVVVVSNAVLRDRTLGAGIGLFWGRRETRLFLYQLALYTIVMAALLLAIVPVAGFWIGMAVAGYFYSRFALILPGVAIDQPLTLHLAWQLSRSHKLGAFVLLWLLPGLAGLFIEGLLSGAALLPFRVLVMFAVTLFFAIVLAVLYGRIVMATSEEPDPGQPLSE